MGGLEVVMGSGCSKHKFTPVGLRDLANREMHVTEKKKSIKTRALSPALETLLYLFKGAD